MTNKNYHTVLEKILDINYDKELMFTESDLRDPRIQIFMLLASHPDRDYTLDEIVAEIDSRGLIKLPERKSLHVLFNLLYSKDLVTHDFETSTYKYKPSGKSYALKNNINLIQAL